MIEFNTNINILNNIHCFHTFVKGPGEVWVVPDTDEDYMVSQRIIEKKRSGGRGPKMIAATLVYDRQSVANKRADSLNKQSKKLR